MNIKEHIEAGHYPVDAKGRALVPMRNGNTFTVAATDKPSSHAWCIIGWDAQGVTDSFDCNGQAGGKSCLLPPPPRKVEVKAWASMTRHGDTIQALHHHQSFAIENACRIHGRVVELTGSYEEEWT